MGVSGDLVVASRVYIGVSILVFVYLCCLRMLERCALVATLLQVYRTFPERASAICEVLVVSFRAALWITLVDYLGEENCRYYYESDLVALLRLRFCNCLRSGLYFTQADEAFACTDRYWASSPRPCTPPPLRFDPTPPAASRELGPLRDYLNMLKSSAGTAVKIHYDEDSQFTAQSQNAFKEVGLGLGFGARRCCFVLSSVILRNSRFFGAW
jgi:hypothetical protein